MAQAASTYLGEQRRRSARIDQTSPIIIRGVDLLGQPFEERTAAHNLSFYGCRYASKHHLPKNTWITVEVPSGELRTDATCMRARVAWIQRPRTQRDLFEVGVELEKGKNLWGVTLPPTDWSNATAMPPAITPRNAPRQEVSPAEAASKQLEETNPLEVYLQMALAHASRDFVIGDERTGMTLQVDQTILEQFRRELTIESGKMIAEARAAAEEAMKQRAGELRENLESAQESRAEAARAEWQKEFEQGKAVAGEEIKSSLTKDVAAQLANFRKQVCGALTKEWAEKLSHVQVERPRWEEEVQALREELRAGTDSAVNRSHETLNEKLMEIRQELESSRMTNVSVGATGSEKILTETQEAVRVKCLAEADMAREQWNELLESSLDSAAQRLNERLTSSSHEVLRRSEQELAKRLAELQKESGLAAETGRSALGELKAALETEVARAKGSLGEIEQTAGRFSEYSRQLEAASQDSLNELRQRLGTRVVQQCAELDRHAAELEGNLSKRTATLLEQMSREVVARSAEEIGATVASGLERAKRAAEELAAREEQAEGILRIHRERLRQVSEQVQREGAAHLASGLANMRKDFESVHAEALAQWNTDLAVNGARATEETSATVARETARHLTDAGTQLQALAQQAIDSSQERIHKSLHAISVKFRSELGEIEASCLGSAREKLAQAQQEQCESTKNEFTKAAENAASKFGQVIEESSQKALQDFSVASEAKAEAERARLVAAGENVLQGVQSHAQSSFEHFQEQLAIKIEQALKNAGDALTRQSEAALEKFRVQGETRLDEWSAKQATLSEHALGQHDARLRATADSWIESVLERLDVRIQERVHSTARATENAARQACADIFDSVAQAMKKQLQTTLEIRPVSPSEQPTSQEQRVSA